MADLFDEWVEAAKAYEAAFGDVFPLMEFGGDYPEAIDEIHRCIESGEPYRPEEGVIY